MDRATSPVSPLAVRSGEEAILSVRLRIGSGVDPGSRANPLDLASVFEYRRLSPSLWRPAHPQVRLPSPYGQMPAPSTSGAHHVRSLFQQLLEPAAPALGSRHADGQGRLALPLSGAYAAAPGVGLPHHGRGLCHLAPLIPARAALAFVPCPPRRCHEREGATAPLPEPTCTQCTVDQR